MMLRMRVSLAFTVITLALTSITKVSGDSLPAFPQKPVVIAGTSDRSHEVGTIYAKSIPVPDQYIGTNGSTVVYRVDDNGDRPLFRFPWFSADLRVALVNDSICVYQPGPWGPGDRARSNHLAFALYRDGKLLRQYSTLELCGLPTNVNRSSSHYTWATRVLGFNYLLLPRERTYRYVFAIKHIDGRILCFDPVTGLQLPDALPEDRQPQ